MTISHQGLAAMCAAQAAVTQSAAILEIDGQVVDAAPHVAEWNLRL